MRLREVAPPCQCVCVCVSLGGFVCHNAYLFLPVPLQANYASSHDSPILFILAKKGEQICVCNGQWKATETHFPSHSISWVKTLTGPKNSICSNFVVNPNKYAEVTSCQYLKILASREKKINCAAFPKENVIIMLIPSAKKLIASGDYSFMSLLKGRF